jgi:hypothetical protein
MLDGDALAVDGAPDEVSAAYGTSSAAPRPGDRDATSFAAGRLRAVRAKRTGAAGLRIEVNGLAGLERFHLAGRARDGFCANVDAEVGLENKPGLMARKAMVSRTPCRPRAAPWPF